MSIASELTRIENAKASIKTAITNKGVTVPSTAKLDTYSTYIGQISTAVPTYITIHDDGGDAVIYRTEFTSSMAGATWFEYLYLGPGINLPGYGALRCSSEDSPNGDVWTPDSGYYLITMGESGEAPIRGQHLLAPGHYQLG